MVLVPEYESEIEVTFDLVISFDENDAYPKYDPRDIDDGTGYNGEWLDDRFDVPLIQQEDVEDIVLDYIINCDDVALDGTPHRCWGSCILTFSVFGVREEIGRFEEDHYIDIEGAEAELIDTKLKSLTVRPQ